MRFVERVPSLKTLRGEFSRPRTAGMSGDGLGIREVEHQPAEQKSLRRLVLIGQGENSRMNSGFADTEYQPRSPRVLIAEDEVLLRLMVADALRENGFQVF